VNRRISLRRTIRLQDRVGLVASVIDRTIGQALGAKSFLQPESMWAESLLKSLTFTELAHDDNTK